MRVLHNGDEAYPAMLAAMSRDHREYDVDELIALHRSVCAPANDIALNGMAEEVKPCRG